MSNKSHIVVIIPCYNEEDSLAYTIEALQLVRAKVSKKYDIDVLLVNDGSKDNTQMIIEELASKFDYIFYRKFSHNAGHQSAVRAGINVARGYDAAIMMDADIQHPPELIPKMLEEWKKGAKVVQMVRQDGAKDVGVLKYLTSRAYYYLLNLISDLNLEYGSSDFRLIDRGVVEAVADSPENDLFLRGYFSWLPTSKVSIGYKPNKRFAGVSKYTWRKMLDLASKGVLQFSEKPLRIATSIGIVLALFSFLYGIFLIVRHLTGNYAVSGWTSLMVVVLICFGINFILIGTIGNYLAHSISIQKRRPEFIIDREKLPAFTNSKK
jgi:polyisoprenyl-phosphate glycosyltransferase